MSGSRLEVHPLHDRGEVGGAIRFTRGGGEHVFYSWVNRLTGDRLSGFGGSPPSAGDIIGWVKGVFRNIRAEGNVVECIGNF